MTILSKTAFAALAALSIGLAGCGGASMSQGVMKADQNQKGGLFGLSTRDSVEVDTAAAFKGKSKVAIGGFSVGFQLEKAESNKAGGGLMGSGFGGKSSAYSKLTGVDNAAMAAIAEAAYADFVKKLQAAGYEVVPAEAVVAHDEFKGGSKLDNPHVASNGGLLTARSETRYFAPAAFGGNRSFMGSIPGEMGGFGFGNPMNKAIAYAEKTGVPVIYVTQLIDFANADGHGGWATNSSSIQVGQGMTMEHEFTKLGIIGGQMGTFSSAVGSLKLGQPIGSDKEFAEVVDATTGTDKGMQVAANVLGVIGGVGTNSKRNYEFRARPADFRAAALDVSEKTNAAFVAKMQSLR